MKYSDCSDNGCVSCGSSANTDLNSLSKSQLLEKVRELDFAKVEAGLYLDAYPKSASALKFYREICERLAAVTALYEAKFGPLSTLGAAASSEARWSWVEGPWPWEYEGKEER